MTATPSTFASQVRFAQRQNRQVPVYSTRSGQTSFVPRSAPPVVVAAFREFPEHTLSGYSDECACEKWADCDYCGACTPDE